MTGPGNLHWDQNNSDIAALLQVYSIRSKEVSGDEDLKDIDTTFLLQQRQIYCTKTEV